MKKYKYNVSTMEVLLWESELTQKPEEHLITVPAQEGDLAWVNDEQKEYSFQDGLWQILSNATEVKDDDVFKKYQKGTDMDIMSKLRDKIKLY